MITIVAYLYELYSSISSLQISIILVLNCARGYILNSLHNNYHTSGNKLKSLKQHVNNCLMKCLYKWSSENIFLHPKLSWDTTMVSELKIFPIDEIWCMFLVA